MPVPLNVQIYTSGVRASSYEVQSLFGEMQKMLAAISASPPYAFQIRKHAELSNMKEVRRLIRQSGLASPFEVSYTPDGITILILRPRGSLSVFLKW
ncbi:hypothetical protein GKZ89_19125 [Bacillus mangrovi]|uniref:Uncharacterized protein n=1 Tax=Metabacillus mangrovi TaxID=1491830 RepID=A0A7X2S8D6_9BACI|nr:hypothetical protein [Metabacillus mangrovi]MTH55509.1 hypothetical protein [Metabacillus mangrovi]